MPLNLHRGSLLAVGLIWLVAPMVLGQQDSLDERLREAARQGDTASAQHLIEEGANPNTPFRDGANALVYAAQRGNTEMVRLLLEAGADPDSRSIMNQTTALHMAVGHPETVRVLVGYGADVNHKDFAVGCTPPGCAVLRRCGPCLLAMLESPKLRPETLLGALALAHQTRQETFATALEEALEESDYVPNWPQFRGPNAAGVADDRQVPVEWDVGNGVNLAWETAIPGLGHSSPVVWGDRVFVTTAVSSQEETDFRPASPMAKAEDMSSHRGLVLCVDRRDGKILWQHTAWEGVPATLRHPKNSFASETPATDGQRVIAFFGSHGLFAFDMDGKPLWQVDIGQVDTGFFFDPDYQWGTASSPILFEDLVIIQADGQKQSFIAAFDAASGELRWKTDRDELPSWSTPGLWLGKPAPELVTNGIRAIRGYDPRTGKQLWQLKTDNSVITAATPVVGPELIFVGSGYRPLKPIYAVRPGSRGDISLGIDQMSNAAVAWSKKSGGPYYITPLVYRDQLYILNQSGDLSSHYVQTGEIIYRTRIGSRRSRFSASPVAADDRIYFASEDGDVYVLRAGLEPEMLVTNPVGEPILATPALVDGSLILRTRHHLLEIAEVQ